jgi:hypothetical protein
MKKSTTKSQTKRKEMLPEYDFRGGVRGKHHRVYRSGHTVRVGKSDGTVIVQHYALKEGTVLLEPDVRRYFADSKSVNNALRTLIRLIPKKRAE